MSIVIARCLLMMTTVVAWFYVTPAAAQQRPDQNLNTSDFLK